MNSSSTRTRIWRRLSAPFQTQPRAYQVSVQPYTESHLSKGDTYHEAFIKHPGRRMMLALEKRIVQELLPDPRTFEMHLDFAGGTGRMCTLLEPYTRKQILLDVSDSMLSVASNHCPNARQINKDFRKIDREIEDESIDLVTAFRFFPNAEAALQEEAIEFIASKLRPSGFLICNNHRNFWSIPYTLKRLAVLSADVGMTNKRMIFMASRHGLELQATISAGLLPQNDRNAILPWKVTERLEHFILGAWGRNHRLGYNVVFLFRRT